MTTTSAAPDQDTRLTPALISLAVAVIVGTIAVQMDATMVNVALDAMRAGFRASVATIQWVSTAYLLAMAIAVPLAGWGADRFGSRALWLGALVVFCAGSMAGGLAWSAPSLIASRALQGLAGGILLPLSQAVLAREAGPKRLGRLMGLVGIPSLLGPIIGPIIGGVVVQYWGWPWIFFINAPISVLAIALAVRMMPRDGVRRRAPFDLPGFALLAPGLAGLLYGLSEAGNRGGFGASVVLVPLAAGIALTAAFVWHAHVTRRTPLIDLRVFRSRSVTAAAGLLFLLIMGLMGAMLLVPLYFQMARGYSALHAGLMLAPQGIGAAVAIAISATLVDHVRAAPVALVGVLLAVAGLTGLTVLGPVTGEWLVGGALMLLGLGFGAVVVTATAVAYRDLDPDSIPRATSAVRIVQQVGASLGVVVLVLALQHAVTEAGGDPARVASAFGQTFWWAVGLTALAVLPAGALLRRHRGAPADRSGNSAVTAPGAAVPESAGELL